MARLREGAEHRAEVVARVTVQDVAGIDAALGWGGRLADVAADDARVHPLRVRPPARELAPELHVHEQPVVAIDGEDSSGAEPRTAHGDALGKRHCARLGSDCDQAVAGDRHAERPQPVAVECGTAHESVREAQPRRAVPWFAEERAVTVERADVGIEPRVVLPRGRHE